MDKSLEQAIEELRGGNQKGFQIIYDQTHNYVFSQARMMLRNEADAKDLVQEVYINAYNSIHSLQDNQKIFSWLGGITFRQATKILRKQKDVLLQSEEDDLFETIVELDPDVQPEQAVDREYTEHAVMELIEKLPPLQQGALTAFYYDEMSIRQIAQAYGCSENTIKSRLNYAKKSLKEYVLEKEKKEGVKLHSVSPAIVIAALYQLFSKDKMPAEMAQSVYKGIVQKLSLTGAAQIAGTVGMTGAAVGKTAAIKTVITAISAVVAITSVGSSIYMADKLHRLENKYNQETVQQLEQIHNVEQQLEQVQNELNTATDEKKDLQEKLSKNEELLQKEQEKVTKLEDKKAEEEKEKEKQQALLQEETQKQEEQKKSEDSQGNSKSQTSTTTNKTTEDSGQKNDTSKEENPFTLDSPEIDVN